MLPSALFFRRASDLSRRGSDKRIAGGFHERAEAMIGLISERDAAISALEYEVRRLNIELQKQTKACLFRRKTTSAVSYRLRWQFDQVGG